VGVEATPDSAGGELPLVGHGEAEEWHAADPSCVPAARRGKQKRHWPR
jgi:hypothetical protein